jgi:hypothetical protein
MGHKATLHIDFRSLLAPVEQILSKFNFKPPELTAVFTLSVNPIRPIGSYMYSCFKSQYR